MKWDGKFAALTVRGFLAVIGIARMLVIIRIVPLADYALIGLVESIRSLASSWLGLGIVESLGREGGIETDRQRFSVLAWSTLIIAGGLSVLAGVVLGVAAWLCPSWYDEPRIAVPLFIAILVTITEKIWSVVTTIVRVRLGASGYFRAVIAVGVIGSLLAVGLTWRYGINGYFHALWLCNVIVIALFSRVVARELGSLSAVNSFTAFKTAARDLWEVSWFVYTFKMSGEMWKRLPIVLAGSYMDKAVLGAFLAAMDMVGKIQIVNQSLWPLLGPRLAGLFASNPREFRVKAKREIFEIGGLNVAVVCLALGAWAVAGGLLVGDERWLAIGSTFYLAMAVEVTVAVPFILNMCVLVPSSALSNIAVPTIFIRASSVVLLVVLIELAVPEHLQLPLAIAAPGAMVAAWYTVVTRNKLRTLANELGPPAF